MLFNSMTFICFLAIVLVFYYAVPRACTKYVILISSCVFYGWCDYRLLVLILCVTAVNYFVALLCNAQMPAIWRKYLLLFSLIFNIGLLCIFKYLNFFAESVSEVLPYLGLHISYKPMDIALPIGLSFITFGMISYVTDVYNGKLAPERDFVILASYVTFFPKLLAGPIERAVDFIPQTRHGPSVNRTNVLEGVWLILWGYFLKVFLADNLGTVVDSIYSNYKVLSGADVIICSYAYAYQIFGDFAGYSYIAIGVSKLLGISLNDNFRFPYFVRTPSEFWRNWHISLSSWIRDYLYIPLGGNRGSRILTYRNLLIAMTLAGLWHGAGWPFVLWGIYHGVVLICFNLLSGRPSVNSIASIKSVAQVFLMFNITCLGWLIFRAPNIDVLATMLSHLVFDFSRVTPKTLFWGLSFLFFAAIPFTIQFIQFRNGNVISAPFKTSLGGVLWCTTIVFLLLVMGNWGTKKFIYLQF